MVKEQLEKLREKVMNETGRPKYDHFGLLDKLGFKWVQSNDREYLSYYTKGIKGVDNENSFEPNCFLTVPYNSSKSGLLSAFGFTEGDSDFTFNPTVRMGLRIPYLPNSHDLFEFQICNKEILDLEQRNKIWHKFVEDSADLLEDYLKKNQFSYNFKYNHTGIEVQVPRIIQPFEKYLLNLEHDVNTIFNERNKIYDKKSREIRNVLKQIKAGKKIEEILK